MKLAEFETTWFHFEQMDGQISQSGLVFRKSAMFATFWVVSISHSYLVGCYVNGKLVQVHGRKLTELITATHYLL